MMRPLKRCANGCDAPSMRPSLVICRVCQDRITATLVGEIARLGGEAGGWVPIFGRSTRSVVSAAAGRRRAWSCATRTTRYSGASASATGSGVCETCWTVNEGEPRRCRPRVAQRTESEITREILRACNLLPGVTLWRVNSRVRRMPGEKGRSRLVRFGGMKGMSDLIGWRMITVTMIARDQSSWPGRYAVWVALEVKRPGQDATAEQQAFLDAVRAAGGLAAVVPSAAEAVEALRGAAHGAGPPSCSTSCTSARAPIRRASGGTSMRCGAVSTGTRSRCIPTSCRIGRGKSGFAILARRARRGARAAARPFCGTAPVASSATRAARTRTRLSAAVTSGAAHEPPPRRSRRQQHAVRALVAPPQGERLAAARPAALRRVGTVPRARALADGDNLLRLCPRPPRPDRGDHRELGRGGRHAPALRGEVPRSGARRRRARHARLHRGGAPRLDALHPGSWATPPALDRQ